MTWEEHLDFLNSATIKELDEKMAESLDAANKAAVDAMNNIHYILKLAQTDKQLIEKIEEVEDKYHTTSFTEGIGPWRLKRMKEKCEKDPEAYKKEWEGIKKFAEKIKAEGIGGLNKNKENNT